MRFRRVQPPPTAPVHGDSQSCSTFHSTRGFKSDLLVCPTALNSQWGCGQRGTASSLHCVGAGRCCSCQAVVLFKDAPEYPHRRSATGRAVSCRELSPPRWCVSEGGRSIGPPHPCVAWHYVGCLVAVLAEANRCSCLYTARGPALRRG